MGMIRKVILRIIVILITKNVSLAIFTYLNIEFVSVFQMNALGLQQKNCMRHQRELIFCCMIHDTDPLFFFCLF